MTPLERAIAANHPSTYKVSDTHIRRESSDAGESAAADSPAPSPGGEARGSACGTDHRHESQTERAAPLAHPWSACHSTASEISSLADRLRLLKGGRA